MKKETIVTLEDNAKYFLAEEIIHENIKYFMANKLDENDDLTDESCIFYETNEDNKVFLEIVEDKDLFNKLTAMYTANFASEVDEMEEETE